MQTIVNLNEENTKLNNLIIQNEKSAKAFKSIFKM